tara:strand:- start:25 stop:591 length:567 start_codon:yes stop_codon:yes gene_type:complete
MYIMKYSYSDWNNKQGTIPVGWQSKDYIELPWYENPDKDQGFTTQKQNYDIYKDRVGCLIPKFEHVGKGIFIPEDVDKIFGYVLNYFDLDDPVYAFAKYKPGLILPWHKDNYPTYARNKKAEVENIARIMIFLHDPAPGHQLWIEDKFCSGPAGSWFSWHGATKHMAANLGETDRYVLQITGKVPQTS